MHFTVDLCDVRLLARQRDKTAARELLDRLSTRLRAEGIDPLPQAVLSLQREIDGVRQP